MDGCGGLAVSLINGRLISGLMLFGVDPRKIGSNRSMQRSEPF